MVEREAEEARVWRTRALAYKKILERYAEAINAGEQKTIPELKALVNPEDDGVRRLKLTFLQEINRPPETDEAHAGLEPYRFERDFLAYAERAFAFVQALEKIHSEVSVSFWLSASEIVELGAADAFDRCILLCSLLAAGGCENTRVRVLELEGGSRHPVVVFYYNEKQHLMDASQEASAFTFTGSLEEILANYSFEGKKALKSAFEFNNAEYNELE